MEVNNNTANKNNKGLFLVITFQIWSLVSATQQNSCYWNFYSGQDFAVGLKARLFLATFKGYCWCPAPRLLLFSFFQIGFLVQASTLCPAHAMQGKLDPCLQDALRSQWMLGIQLVTVVGGLWLDMWPTWPNQMKEKLLHSVLGGSHFLSLCWTCTGKLVTIPVVAGCCPASKRKANRRTKWI